MKRKDSYAKSASKPKDKSGAGKPVKAEKVPAHKAKDSYSRPSQKQKM